MDLSKLTSAPTLLGATSNETKESTERTDEVLEADSAAAEWNALLGQGETVRSQWLRAGLLVPSAELAAAWECSRQALDLAVKEGELFDLKIGDSCYYPAVFTRLEMEAVKAVCSRLKGEDVVAKFVFWNRQHGGLSGLTPADTIRAGHAEKVSRVAEAWSVERGFLAHT